MHYDVMSRQSNTEQRTAERTTIAPDRTYHVSFVSRARINEGQFRIETIHFLLIKLNSIRFGGNIRIASYRETTYYASSMFFSRSNAASHVTPG